MDDLFDDPIADLLSEGDDSFFEDPKSKAKKVTKPISNIFDLGDKITTDPIKEIEVKVGDNIETPKTDMFNTKPMENIQRKSSFDKGDVSDLLETQDTKKSKASIMNDILGISNKDEQKVSSFDDILKSSTFKKEPPRKVEEIDKVIEPRRIRRSSANLDPLGLLDIVTKSPESKRRVDPIKFTTEMDIKPTQSLGLLESSEKSTDNLTKASKSVSFLETKEPTLISEFSSQRGRRGSPKKQKIESGLPDWLDGSSTSLQSKNIELTIKPAVTNIPDSEDKTKREEIRSVFDSDKKNLTESVNVQDHSVSGGVFDTILKQQSSNLDIQSSFVSLQQQEGQLLMALQLKKYEQNLADMQKVQQEILSKQEKQFEILIEKQFAKQQLMEENMRLQQERINQHIQILLSQPISSSLKHTFEEQQQKEDLLKDTFEENRKFYSDIITSLKQKNQEEIFLLEESYKKQITFLETSLDSTENRLKSEIENLNSYYTNKFQEMSTKHSETIQEYEEKIKTNNKNNEILLNEVKNNYVELIQEIKNEYKHMIDDINENKNKEHEVINNTGTLTIKLSESLDILKNNSVQVGQMQSSIVMEKNLLNDIKEGTLSAKENEIKMMQQSLEKQKVATDSERAQLLALIKTLEMRLVEQTQVAREERWTLQQATATISARAVAMDREIEYLKKNLEHEREELKNLKESQLAEHEKIMLQLTEEKLAISAEKSRLKTAVKLSQNYDSNKGRAEIEAAIQIAKEATDLTDREREKLCKHQTEIESLKRILIDKEQKLIAREKEIENISKITEQRYKDGEKALLEAKMIENKCDDRMKDVQRHLSSLTSREKKLAEDKIALSKERLMIHNIKQENKCGLCKVDGFQNEHEDNIVEQVSLESYKVQDMELLRLRLELDDVPTSIRSD